MLQVNTCLGQADTPVELTWEAPDNCAQQAQVQQQLRALIGSSGENTNAVQPGMSFGCYGIISKSRGTRSSGGALGGWSCRVVRSGRVFAA